MNSVATDEKKPPEVVAQNIADADEHRLLISELNAQVSRAAEMLDLYTRAGSFLVHWHRSGVHHPTYQLVSRHRAEMAHLLAQMKPPVFL